MRFNLLVLGGAYDSQCAYSAWRFASAAIEKGHHVSQVFFYQNGVHQASQLLNPLSDEFNSAQTWQSLAQEHELELRVCIAAAERRGIMDENLAREFNELNGNLAAGFQIAGLGEWQRACLESDRSLTFK